MTDFQPAMWLGARVGQEQFDALIRERDAALQKADAHRQTIMCTLDYDAVVKDRDLVRQQRDMAIEQRDSEEKAAMESGGILSDVCDILFEDGERALSHGYVGAREMAAKVLRQRDEWKVTAAKTTELAAENMLRNKWLDAALAQARRVFELPPRHDVIVYIDELLAMFVRNARREAGVPKAECKHWIAGECDEAGCAAPKCERQEGGGQ